ncbi:MAG: hypothetical protein HONBIEJF_02010 [Fimbriimonadaceae bacterium]|nr:hypothetical protein [Fimbriimonadaceae bacterium]
MIGAADGPVDPSTQAVMFYVYASDLSVMRRHLLLNGLEDGGDYTGGPRGDRVVFNPRYPDYLPDGEMRVHDPDGYVVLVATVREAVP